MAYNGWTNYETWCVNLHLNNTQADQEFWAERARFCMTHNNPDNDYLDARCELAEAMQDAFLEKYDEQKPDSSVLADLLQAALSEVNWHEIATAFVDGCKEEVRK